jgi:hypothetical protein
MAQEDPPAEAAAQSQADNTVSPTFYVWYARAYLLVAIGIILYGCVQVAQTISFAEHAVHGQAAVADYHVYPPSGKDKHSYYEPIMEYKDMSGKVWRKMTGTSNSSPEYKIGQRLGIVYVPGDAGNARLDSFSGVWGTCIGIVALGCFAGVIGVIALVYLHAASARTGGIELHWWDRWFAPLKILTWFLR